MALFHIYDDPKPEGYYSAEPDALYRTILDADWILYLLLPLLLVIVVYLMIVAWRIHEIPHHRADHKKMRQIELVTALTLLGLFMHWVWAVALFLAYFDWADLENTLVRILRRARSGSPDDLETAVSAQPVPAGTPQITQAAPPSASATPPKGGDA